MSENIKLPEGYKEGVERVSNIVSFVFPFDGNSKERYLKWLELNNVPEPDYMEEAQTVGTFVHKQMEDWIINGKTLDNRKKLYKLHKDEIDYGIEWLKQFEGDECIPEEVVRDHKDRYQGTIDLVRIDEKNKKVWLYDFKTWGIAKKRFELPNKYKKPYDKIKKVALQLSLYAEYYRQKGYSIEGIYVIWLHETGSYEFELDLYSSAEIDDILRQFELKKLADKTENMSFDLPFEVEILEPTKTYGNIKVKLDLDKVDNGKEDKENIDELIKKAKYIASKLK